uniref:hypothetical protein n=1 Tax=Castellaniella defragrans TaxID=75697 RepID=UPI00333EE045
MSSHVNVIFDARHSIEIPVEAKPDPQAARQACQWFQQQWESLGCEPLRASGKVLLLDKILGVADALGYKLLSADAARAEEFARQVVLALERPRVTVDLPGLTIAY